jgi:PAS domain S-box-containing protein
METAMKKERLHVLVVEDEEAHAELIKRAFEPQSDVIRLSVARSLKEARKSLTESLPDLAIVDLFLPDGRGLELLDDDSDGPDYPVVIVTSHGDEEVAVEAMKAGALQYVVKSEVALAELPHKVETALRQWGHIVERKQAEAALQSSEEHFRSLIENALDIITVVDRDGKICYASPSCERVLGFEAVARFGRDALELVHPDDRDALAALIEAAFTTPPTGRLVYRHRHADGTWRHLEAVGSSYLHSSDGYRAVINSRDVTDREHAQQEKKELQGRLRHVQKWEIVANLAGDIARQFNDVLSPILDYATIALQQTPPGSPSRAGLERVLAAAHHARTLAEQIFVFSRRDASRIEPVRLQDLVERELAALDPNLPGDVELHRDLDAGCSPVAADPVQMREILRNLFSNALYAMREQGGRLDVSLKRVEGAPDDAGTVRLLVRDSGHGMDAETLQRALEAFFTTKTAGVAAGLGLSVAHAIVASYGGELTVTSEPGKGTSIQVDLACAS